jgi:phosphatidylserine/phosphatidylglycerophosphate/cardiolipin synthase-like enzyme
VKEARSTIDIEHAYLLSHPWLLELLGAAVRRGVRVRAFTNSGASNDLAFMNWRLATSVRSLVDAGVTVFRRSTRAATLHTKLIVADGRRVVFGSTNLDYYSPVYCAELDIAIESESLGAALTALVDEGIGDATTDAVLPGSRAAAGLDSECNPWSVSRVCDLVLHDIQ